MFYTVSYRKQMIFLKRFKVYFKYLSAFLKVKKNFLDKFEKSIDLLCTQYIISVYTEREVIDLSPRTGRPKSANPKNIQLKIRADKELIADLDYCCKCLNKNRSDIIRLGIQKVKAELEK